MEFHEKLQELRKRSGLTQEELAEVLFVSRTAISKWESGRGYPSIDSLKAISAYFSVSIDDLLSGDKLIFIAEKENSINMRKMCDVLFGMTDLLAFLMIVLPLYSKTIEGHVYSVNLWIYNETAIYNRVAYWTLYLLLVLCGILKLLQVQKELRKENDVLTGFSFLAGLVTAFYLVLAREAYAATLALVLIVVKGLMIYRCIKLKI